jgi:DHA1 family bicyclomycin/chloramphenicol resistance-like MFS transporter
MSNSTNFMFALIVAGTIVGLAGIDLVLPAVPGLPNAISGTLEQAQFVLAAFAGGIALGLLFFGELGARFDQRRLLIVALIGYGVFSALASMANAINELSLYRIAQGFMASAPAVFAPGMIRVLFKEREALRALGLMSSIESVVPALAPVLGAWLLMYFDWRVSFFITAALAIALSFVWLIVPGMKKAIVSSRSSTGYGPLFRSGSFLRYALSQAFTLGGLLIFVFGAPTVITITMNGSLADFVTMQIIGISLFIVATNTAHAVVARFGTEITILSGSALAACGSIAVLVYGLIDGSNPKMLWLLFAFVNLGLGIRSPPGFYQAVVAAGDNDSRGAAVVILLVFLTTAVGTALVAPMITGGLVPLAAMGCGVSVCSVIVLLTFPSLPESVSKNG